MILSEFEEPKPVEYSDRGPYLLDITYQVELDGSRADERLIHDDNDWSLGTRATNAIAARVRKLASRIGEAEKIRQREVERGPKRPGERIRFHPEYREAN